MRLPDDRKSWLAPFLYDNDEGANAGGMTLTDDPPDPDPDPTPEPTEPTPDPTGAETLLDKVSKESGGDPEQSPDNPLAFTERPEWVAEKHWDSEKGEIKLDSALKSLKDTQTELHRLQHGKGPGIPEKAEGYLDGDAFDEKGFTFDAELEIPQIPRDDPILQALAEIGHAKGLKKDTFNDIVRGVYPKMMDIVRPQMDVEQELIKLGRGELKDGTQTALTVDSWFKSLEKSGEFNAEEAARANEIARDAVSIRLMAKLRNLTGEKEIPVGMPLEGEGVKSKKEIDAMMDDPLYLTDPSYRAKVYAEMERANPTQG